MSYQDISRAIRLLLECDNNSRRQGELYFSEQLSFNPTNVISILLSILSTPCEDLILRSLAGVLLRRCFQNIDIDSIPNIRSTLMNLWSNEIDATILRRIAHIMAQCATSGKWVDLLPSIVAYSPSLSGESLESLINLVSIISEYCPDDIHTHVKMLKSFLDSMIVLPNYKVQVASALAIGACINSMDEDTSLQNFQSSLLPIINVLGETLNRRDEIEACAIINHMISIAEVQPLFLKGCLDNVVNAMLTIANSNALEFSTRSAALELMVTITESAPTLARRSSNLISGLVTLSMSIILDLDQSEEEWISEEYVVDTYEDNCYLGEEAIERASNGIGGKLIFPLVLGIVQQYSSNPSYAHRRGAVAAVSRLAEGAKVLFKKDYFKMSQSFLLQALNDHSPRVQYQAIQAVGQFALLYPDTIPSLLQNYFQILINFLTNPNCCERVKGHAISAMINLICPSNEDDDDAIRENIASNIELFLNQLLTVLSQLFSVVSMEVQIVCLTLVGAIAQTSNTKFIPYYGAFMPGMKGIMMSNNSESNRLLRGKAMECVGLISEAVGLDIFANDAMEILQSLIQTMKNEEVSGVDFTFEYILPTCARISSALGAQFEPFLPTIMAPLLEGANQVISFSMTDAEADEADGEVMYDEDLGTETAVISVGPGVKKRCTLNTHAVQQKNQCARLLYEFSMNLKGHLGGYIVPSMEACLSMTTDKYSSDIRISSSLAVTKIFEAALDSFFLKYLSQHDLSAILSTCLFKLLEAIKGEINSESRAYQTEALRDVLITCFESGSESLDCSRDGFACAPDVNSSIVIIQHLLERCEESLHRKNSKELLIQSNKGLDAEDVEECKKNLNNEYELITVMIDAIGQLIKIHRQSLDDALTSFVIPIFLGYLTKNSDLKSKYSDVSLLINSVCIFDDIIEYAGGVATNIINQCLTVFLGNMTVSENTRVIKDDNTLLLKQCSSYGVAQCLRRFPEVCVGGMNEIIGVLYNAFVALKQQQQYQPDDDSDFDLTGIVENILFAFGIVVHNPRLRNSFAIQTFSTADMSQLWLQSLPLTADENESKLCSLMLCEVIEQDNFSIIRGDNSSFILPHFFRVAAEIFSNLECDHRSGLQICPYAHSIIVPRIKALLVQIYNMQSNSPTLSQSIQQSYSLLSGEHQNFIQNIVMS